MTSTAATNRSRRSSRPSARRSSERSSSGSRGVPHRVRIAHVRALFALGRTVLAEHGSVAVELLAETDELTIFGGSLRFDAVAAGPKFFDLEVEPVPGLPVGFGFEHDGAQVAFGQFSWNRCTVQARGIGDAWPAALRTWIAGAMDLAEAHQPDANGLSGVIHSVRHAVEMLGVLRFDVDFGSASIDVPHELMTVLVGLGASVVVFGGSARL